VIDGNLLHSLNFNFFKLPNGQLLDAIKGPAVGEREDAEPCLKRGFVYRVFAVRRQQTLEATYDVADLRVIEHPEEPCEIFALDILKSIGVMVRRTEFLVAAVVRAADLLAEELRLALEEITMYTVEVIFDLRTHVSAQ
jgi:hypothetical protein